MKKHCIILFLLLIFSSFSIKALVIYVKADALGSNNGNSWTNGFVSFQSALDIALSGDKIWVAKGTYIPTYDYTIGSGVRGKHFRLIEGVEIYGGLSGTEPYDYDLNLRNFSINETILSGDLAEDDEYSTNPIGNNGENCYHVFYHPNTLNPSLTNTAILDGFTVIGGNANGADPHLRGGGIYNNLNNPLIKNCIIKKNTASYGGGMWNEKSNPYLNICYFQSNSSIYYGGGLMNFDYSNPSLTNCTFSDNFTYFTSSSNGGGICNYNYSNPSINNCIFSNNSAFSGGGIYNENYCHPNITNCDFSANFSGNSNFSKGGGLCNYNFCDPVITNCSFSMNSAINGGGIYNYYSSPELINCSLSYNTSDFFGGGMYNENSSPIIKQSSFEYNLSPQGYGGGIRNDESNPIIENCIFIYNYALYSGGGICNVLSDGKIINCNFINNSCDYYGGGIFNQNCNSTISNCTFTNNIANNGGGIGYFNCNSQIIDNCTFSDNIASDFGGGIFNNNSNLSIINCTISKNSATNGGGIGGWENGNPIVMNSIVYGNLATFGNQIYIYGEGITTLNYSCFPIGANENIGTITETNCIHTDPLLGSLADNGGPTKTCALGAGSPCINAGTSTDAPTTDQRGMPRVGNVDIGAYEYQQSGTTTDPPKDNLVLWFDANDIDANGVADPPAPPAPLLPGQPWQVDSFFDIYVDLTIPPNNAKADKPEQKPKKKVKPTQSGRNTSVFESDYNAYGNSDMMIIEPSTEITSPEIDMWKPVNSPKSLFIAFTPGDNNDDSDNNQYPDPNPYWSDGRKCLFEAGGPLSGYNMYLTNGYLVIGAWNRFQSLFFQNLMPVEAGLDYLAHMEYYNGKMRAVLSSFDGTTTSTVCSPWENFAGITLDGTDDCGLGGASRTRYHDFNIGSTYSDEYSGTIDELLLYNKALNHDETKQVFDHLSYGMSGRWTFDDGFDGCYSPANDFPKSSQNWLTLKNTNIDPLNEYLLEVYPNPFSNYTTLQFYLNSKKRVIIELFNPLGKSVQNIFKGQLDSGMQKFRIDGSKLVNGIYIYKIIIDGEILTGKIILNK